MTNLLSRAFKNRGAGSNLPISIINPRGNLHNG